MKQTEKLLGILVFILMITRLLIYYPFSSLAITLTTVFLSILYFYCSFALLNNIRLRYALKSQSYKGISKLRIIATIFSGFIISCVLIYVLFKFQLWPYGHIGLQISLYGLYIVGIITLIKYVTTKDIFYTLLLKRLAIIGIAATCILFISSESFLEMKNRGFPEYVEAEKALMKDPQNEDLLRRVNVERMKMDLYR
ncbi:hypothetical protein [uncultured Psychroserpens sp.]|uniref:hypothetical protein n=1 Tax=uncultured Psychroserpens sp. TaxID=255436 RepID=UPI002625454E|nr:hypothetical protein [uncultured Psychroserpens sp.]